MAISLAQTFTVWKGHASTSLNSTSTALGAGDLLVVNVAYYRGGAGWSSASNISITWNGSAMTELAAASQRDTTTGNQLAVWYMVSPASVTSTVNITFTQTPSAAVACATLWSGLATPYLQNGNKASGTSRTPAVGITGSSTSNVVLNFLSYDRASGSLSSPVAPATIIWNDNDNTDQGGGAAQIASAGSGTVTMDWTNKFSASLGWECSGLELVAAGGGGGFTPKFRKTLSGIGTGVGKRQIQGG